MQLGENFMLGCLEETEIAQMPLPARATIYICVLFRKVDMDCGGGVVS